MYSTDTCNPSLLILVLSYLIYKTVWGLNNALH
jgi:hypothetical protein